MSIGRGLDQTVIAASAAAMRNEGQNIAAIFRMKKAMLAPLEGKLAGIASILKAFANEVRLRIVWRLAISRRELPIAALASGISVSQSALSQHLAILRKHKIVAVRRVGRNHSYRLADSRAKRLAIALHKMAAHIHSNDKPLS